MRQQVPWRLSARCVSRRNPGWRSFDARSGDATRTGQLQLGLLRGTAALLAVFDHPAPVVAAVNGHAIAGGCVFAMAADVRLMSAGTIGITELAVGVPFPMAALEICRYAMGTSARRAALQADTIDVAAASARGWIDEVVAPADLIPRAIAVARELGQHTPTAYAATKEQLHRPARTAIDAGAETGDRDCCYMWSFRLNARRPIDPPADDGF